jgi:peptide/nickel transport system substrate-binding protein
MKPRWQRVLALFLGLSLIAAACGDDDDSAGGDTTQTTEGTDTTDGEASDGGRVVFAADQEPDGWNINTASSNLLALGMLTEIVFPSAFRTTPDFEVVMDENLLESAEMTSEEPQVVEYVISEDAVWSDGTPISADDFIFMWEMMNGENAEIDTATTAGYDRVETVEGSEDGKTVTVTFSQPFAEWEAMFTNILPAHIVTELGDGDPVVGWNDGLDGEAVPEFSGGPFMFEDYRP